MSKDDNLLSDSDRTRNGPQSFDSHRWCFDGVTIAPHASEEGCVGS